jgi:hypothetical protein
VPATIATFLAFFLIFLLWPLTVHMKQTRKAGCAVKQSILLGRRQTFGRQTFWPTDFWPTDVWPTDVWLTDMWPTDIWPTDVWPTDVWLTDVWLTLLIKDHFGRHLPKCRILSPSGSVSFDQKAWRQVKAGGLNLIYF